MYISYIGDEKGLQCNETIVHVSNKMPGARINLVDVGAGDLNLLNRQRRVEQSSPFLQAIINGD